jgi:hypothetical protein
LAYQVPHTEFVFVDLNYTAITEKSKSRVNAIRKELYIMWKLYGAAAVIPENVHDFALRQGF